MPSWLELAARNGAPWLIVTLLLVGLITALRSGRLRTDREVQELRSGYESRIQELREHADGWRSLYLAEADRATKDAVNRAELTQGLAAVAPLMRALMEVLPPARQQIGGGP